MNIKENILGKFLNRYEFRKQIIVVFSAGILFLAVVSSVVLSSYLTREARSQIMDQGIKIAEALGRQSKLALLYKSSENAEKAAQTSLSFPDVIGLSIRDETGETILEQGKSTDFISATGLALNPELTEETDDTWVFSAPVYSETESVEAWLDINQPAEAENLLLGHVYIIVSKQTLKRLEREILNTNLSISFTVALAILVILLFLTQRLTVPLDELARVMGRAKKGESNIRAKINGPIDITSMQNAFNAMMEVLERRELELCHARDMALESARVKGEFAANVSHELRTPMNAVIGMLDLLASMKMGARENEYLETAKQAGQQLLALIDDILNFAEIDSGKLSLEISDVNIADIVEDVIDLLGNQALRKNLDLGYVVASNVPVLVKADPWRIKQVLINLIGNAIKFTSKGQIGIRVLLPDPEHYPERILFRVEDTGIGISEKARDKIFQAFTQADSTTTKEYGGTGLGLTISRELITLMGGTIRLTSELGKGSTFDFELSCEKVDSSDEKPVESRPYDGLRILVADDSTIVQDFCQTFFNKHCVHLVQTGDGFETLEAIRVSVKAEQEFDLLLLDEELPGFQLNDFLKVLSTLFRKKRPHILIGHNQWGNFKLSNQQLLLAHKPLTEHSLDRVLIDAIRVDVPRLVEVQVNHVGNSLDKTVLIVDDNRANRQVASAMLARFGCKTLAVENGEKAIEILTRSKCDLVFMDCNMPVMDGYEATRLIRSLEGHGATIPIVAMTANNLQKDFDRCLEAGMNDVCPKPLTLQALRESLIRVFDCDVHLIEAVSRESGHEQSTGSFDRFELETLKESIDEVFFAMLEAFLEDTPVYLKTLGIAVEANDSQQIYELAHTIKGSAMNFSAHEVAALSRQLEEMGRSGNLQEAAMSYEKLQSSYRRLSRDLDDYLAEASLKSNARTIEYQVLIVDDDRSMRVGLKQALSSEGFGIREAENGRQAITICKREVPDLILLDAVMPVMDGFTACKQIRSLPSAKDIPILIITGLDDELSIARAFSCGATDYIPKPVNFSVLRQRVSRLMETSKNAQHIKQLAYQDPLTALPNRTYLMQNLRHMTSRASLKGENLAVLFLDLDRFKLINDSMGHDTGDLLLKAVAERIKGCIREKDVIARLGGDEFTVILESIPSREVAAQVATKICASLRNPFVFLKQKMFVSTSVGISIYPDDGEDVSTLLKHADTAMFKAKEKGDSFCFYERGMADEVALRVQLERELRQALESDQIVLHYQPQKCLQTGVICSVEALVRWNHPERGLLTAEKFIPIAEESGLIALLGNRVFEIAFRQMREWCDRGHQIRIAINLSGGEMASGQLTARVKTLLSQYNLSANLVELEITESMLMEQPELAETELSALREMGVSVAIDDFGTGFSSLNYLKRFSIDVLKIDRSFVRDCVSDKNDRAIISSVLALARSLDLKVVAEGVETLEQQQFLTEIDCDYIQGFFIGRPVAAENAEQLFPDISDNRAVSTTFQPQITRGPR